MTQPPVLILKPNKKGYLWTYFSPHLGKGLVFFEVSLSRSATVPEERLKSFTGLLQTDGYAGYQALRKRKGIVGFGCLTHCRRKFDEVLKLSKNSEGVAAEFIERVKPLYSLEARMRDVKLNFHSRKRLRQRQSWPIMKALHQWLRQQKRKVPPNSTLGKAIQYTVKQWPYVSKYLRHGSAEIDTNWVENAIRPVALGRKNWLFMKNKESGLIHALWYSVIQSAMLNNLNPRVYVYFILSKIHDIRRKEVDLQTLLPHTIDVQQLNAFAKEQIAIAKHVFNNV